MWRVMRHYERPSRGRNEKASGDDGWRKVRQRDGGRRREELRLREGDFCS